MRFHPTRIHLKFLCFILVSIYLCLSCSKDSDLLLDSVINDEIVAEVMDGEANTEEEPQEETVVEEAATEEPTESNLESRTTSFPPNNDGHVQSGKGYNQRLIRLEEGSRTSYLMFDLSPIDLIGGNITTAKLQFTINGDDGSGKISVYAGKSNDWTEESLSEENAPETDIILGAVQKEFPLGSTEIVELSSAAMQTDVTTLILVHEDGNDLAFASKENTEGIGPKLVVTYDAPKEAEEIVIVEEDNSTVPEEEEDTSNSEDDTTNTEEPVNEEPMAIADATPSSGGVSLEVSFTGSNSSDDNGITTYLWDFKDGSTATIANPKHTFTAVGSYVVELTVKDAEGLATTDAVTITINDSQNEGPKARTSATPTTGVAPFEVSFIGSTSTDDVAITKYDWDFKDGEKGNAADPKHTYTTAGVYTVILTVTDENGLSDKASVAITVTEPTNEAPVAKTSANTTAGTAPLVVQFIGDKSTDDKGVTGYTWDFKDGSTATTANPSHSFTTAGTYVVELTVSDLEGLTHKNTITIGVSDPVAENEAPIARVSANITSGDAPLTVQFTGSQSSDDNGITSYSWNFKDSSTSTSANPSHTFNSAGTYSVELTVQDAAGLTSTANISIVANQPVVNAPPGLYVATNGNSSNNGQSPSSPWSLEHAFSVAKAGDIVYVKAGNYGYKQLLTRDNGHSGNPIKFIGYRNNPGDITSSQGSTFNFGENVDSSKMPLLNSSSGSGMAITLHHAFIHIENFQINGYGIGIQSIDIARNAVLKNIIVTNSGNQNNSSSYDGFGMTIRGDNTLIENCFVLNANAEAIKLFNADNSTIRHSKVYASNGTNPTDYYFFIAGGTDNAVIENCRAERSQGLSHGGHGFNIKDNGSYNTIRNCTAIRTNFELSYSGVHHNTIDGGAIYGISTSPAEWHAVMSIYGGAHDNLIKNLLIQDTWTAIALATYDDRTGADASLGINNTFENVTIKNTNRVLNIGGGTNYNAKAKNYTFKNCNFSDFGAVAVVYYGGENFKFENCSFNNGNALISRAEGVYMNYNNLIPSWINCNWANVNFTPPN